MHHLLKHTVQDISLHESTATLALRGIQLTKEDIQALQQTQRLVCERRQWIEVSSTTLEQILISFLSSPYMSNKNYLEILKNNIIVYYEARSRFQWHISDATIIEELVKAYNVHQGEQDTKYLQIVLKQLKKRVDHL